MRQPVTKLSGNSDIKWLLLMLCVSALMAFVLLNYLEKRHQVYNLGYELANQTQQHNNLLEENRRLTIETAMQSNADRLESEAIQRLGLRPTEPAQVVPGMVKP